MVCSKHINDFIHWNFTRMREVTITVLILQMWNEGLPKVPHTLNGRARTWDHGECKSLSRVRLFRPQGLYSRILQARILEWAAFPFSRGSSPPRNRTRVSGHCRRILYQLSHQGSSEIMVVNPYSVPWFLHICIWYVYEHCVHTHTMRLF